MSGIAINNIYKILDGVIPGGTVENLDRSMVPDRKLYLTRLSMDGLYDMHEYSKDARLYKFFEFTPFKDLCETKDYLQKLINRVGDEVNGRKFMYWFIRAIDNDKVIGSIGLVDIDAHRGSAAWGYAIAPEYWGRGFILETQLIVISYFFEVLKMNRLWGVTSIDNEPTISSVLAAGFRQEGILRDYYRFTDGKRKDGLIYSLLSKDYYNAKKKSDEDKKGIALTLEKLKKIFAVSLQISKSGINIDTKIDDIYEWDSLNHVVLIALIEKETTFKFTPFEIARATSVRAILEIVNNRAGRELKNAKR